MASHAASPGRASVNSQARLFSVSTAPPTPLPTERINIDFEEGSSRSRRKHSQAPIDRAGILSYLLYLWIFPLIKLGYERPLTQDDMPPIGVRDESAGLCRDLEREWHKQLQREKPSLFRACFAVVGKSFIILTTIAYAGNIGAALAQPFFLGKMVGYFNAEIAQREAYLLAMGFVILSFLRSLIYHMGFFVGRRSVGMQLRTGLTALVHKKVLQLSHSALLKVTTGHVINLVSTDVQRFDEVATLVASLWWGPLTTIGILILLYLEIGHSCLAGFAILPFIFLFQYLTSNKMSRYRTETAKQTDVRIRLMNEIITGMQLIKMYTWEKPFHKIISAVRKMELSPIRRRWVLFALSGNINEIGVPLMSFLSLTTYVYTGHELTASTAFIVVSLLATLRTQVFLLQVFAVIISAETAVAFRRIQEFLVLAENSTISSTNPHDPDNSSPVDSLQAETGFDQRGESPVQPGSPHRHRVDVRHLYATWEPLESKTSDSTEVSDGFKLEDINFSVSAGELYAIVGTVGAGKTSLLMAILGELHVSSGHCNVRGDIAYASQLPWVFSGTIQENILFGKALDIDQYEKVMECCGLDEDVRNFSHGDLTLVGERGVKLSGGQKARIGLARALYQDAAVYLLDDPLSAVDAEVGRMIFDRCLRGLLKDKPVILVTHQLRYLSEVSRIVVLDKGKPLGTYSYRELVSSGLDVAKYLAKESEVDDEEEESGEDKATKSAVKIDNRDDEKEQDEDRVYGSVTWRTYWKFLRAGTSTVGLVLAMLLCLVSQGCLNVTDWWLAYWTTHMNVTDTVAIMIPNCSTPDNCTDIIAGDLKYDRDFFVAIWGGLIALSTLLAAMRGLVLRFMFVRSASSLHDTTLASVLKAPMLFFDTNASGRILNRFAKDLNLLDIQMPWVFYDCIVWMLVMIGAFVFVSVINPWTILAVIPLSFAYAYLRRRYIKSSRELKRIEAIARSPVFSQFSTTLHGLTTIRAFHASHRLQDAFYKRLDAHSRAWLSFVGTTRWLAVRLELMSSVYLTVLVFAALLVVDYGSHVYLDAGTLGLAITYLIALYGYLQWVVRTTADTENLMTSVERLFSYTDLEPETEPSLAIEPPADWPKYGIITGERMTYRYSPTSPAILKGLNFCIRHKEKVGIVGRTGAGKSSFINALFRLAPTSGTVMIDGVALDKVHLATMREKMSIIPQDPVLYSGTLRYNLDPFGRHPDDKLWNALEMVQMKSHISQLDGGLSFELSETGGNFSVGQRQLLCLARALLNHNRILMIDEATANVDNQTDAIIQQTLRTRFEDCTVVTIAHRLNTIMDSDRIMVIDNGRIKEFDEPLFLLEEKKDSAFAGMVRSLGEEEGKRLIEACRQKRYWTEDVDKKYTHSLSLRDDVDGLRCR